MAAVKQYHKLFEATFLEHRKLFEATFSCYCQLFGLNQNRRPQGGDFVSAKLLLIILCLRVPQLTVHPAVISEQLAVWTICPLSNTAILSQKRQEKSHFNLPILPTQIE